LAGDVRPLVRLNVSVIVEQDGRREQGSSGGGGRVGYGWFLDEDRALGYAREAVRQALVNLDAVAAPAGTMTVVLGPGWPGSCCTKPSVTGWKAISTAKARRPSAGGSASGSPRRCAPWWTTAPWPAGAVRLNIDDEGTPTQCTTLIERGVLKGYLQDKLNARLMKTAPTGNGRRESYAHLPLPRMTNTYMLAGEHDPAEIIASVERGSVRGQFRRRPGGHYLRQIRVLRQRGVSDRKWPRHPPGQGRNPDRQRPGRADQVSMVGNDLQLDAGSAPAARTGRACRWASVSRP
jgi:TldD protein